MAEAVTAEGPLGVTGSLGLLLRLEGLTLFAGAVLLYALAGSSWLLFAALLLAPDLSFAGYLCRASALPVTTSCIRPSARSRLALPG